MSSGVFTSEKERKSTCSLMIIASFQKCVNQRHSMESNRSFMEWSEEIIAFLAISDYQEFIFLLTAAASSEDVIQADVMSTGVLSKPSKRSKEKITIRSKIKQIEQIFKPKTRLQKIQGFNNKQFKTLPLSSPHNQKKTGAENINRAQGGFFSGTLLLHAISGDPNVKVRRIHANVKFRSLAQSQDWRFGVK